MNINNKNLLVAYESFEERLEEVKEYLDFVQKISEMDLPTVKGLAREQKIQVSRNLQKSLRATSYLLLYNLIESTMSETIDSIHETIKQETLEIVDLSEKIHKVVLSSFQKGISEASIVKFHQQNEGIRNTVLELGYNKKRLFSGNIDCKIITEFASKYGFRPFPYTADEGRKYIWDKEIIREIKQKRNSLAHGSESFVTCGQNMPIDTLLKNLESVYAVLMAVFNGVNIFLNDKKYLRNSC